ncbi:MAG: glycosyltransferase family protein, partial [Acetatifactor sp.]|nr:glycosyltransferase family protein [Acetatifactor sp.]
MKVDFIICTNSDLWYSECVKYIENLIVPDNVEIGVLGITDASGMAEGYELGRSSSEADYKVYLHQDTFIINRHFIEDIDAVFRSDDRIGVIGMLGNDDVADQKFSWESWRWGKVISCTGIKQLLLNRAEVTEKYRAVD